MKKRIIYILIIALFYSCEKEGCTDTNAHNFDPKATKDDGTCIYGLADSLSLFTYQVSDTNSNVFILTANETENLEYIWDLDNGKTSTGSSAIGIYPFSGIKNVKLTVYNSQGSSISYMQINVPQDNFTLLTNPMAFFLSGGFVPKTWHVDSNSAGHLGIGPATSNSPDWYASQPNEKVGVGLYDDRYIFNLNDFLFEMQTNGLIYIHNSLSSLFPGSYENAYDYSAPFTDPPIGNWDISDDSILTLSQGMHMGFYTGVNQYKITKLNDDTLWLEYGQLNEPDNKWYAKFISIP